MSREKKGYREQKGFITDYWILDQTCSYHMTPNKDQLDTYKLVNSSFVLMNNNDPCKVF